MQQYQSNNLLAVGSPDQSINSITTLESAKSVTSDIGNNTFRLIRISKTIANHFIEHSKNCAHCTKELKITLAKQQEEEDI